MDSFLWAEDATKRLDFEPMFPDSRRGGTPDDQLEAMHRIGFHFGTEESEVDQSVAAAFAPADEMTGVRLTPEFLELATFTCEFIRNR
ncbi:DUF6461 domain-containing protein [Kitasatospora sp. NPDC050463]|uniref:DUF6461 domain-containing protein n=1 Tax=Kitasatospora sp. NPDC050463 TaxID=3155786 RepID=UPI0033D1B704